MHKLPVVWTVRLAVLRLITGWRSLLTIIVGVLLAAIIGANAPLYTATVAQIGMVDRVNDHLQAQVNIFTRFTVAGSEIADIATYWSALSREVHQLSDELFAPWGGWADQVVEWGETSSLIPVRDDVDMADLKLRVGYFQDWTEHVRLVAGTLPTDPADVDLEAAISVELAAQYGLAVGDVLTLDQRGWETSQLARVRISAIVAPADPIAPYWMAPSPLRIDGGANPAATLLTTRASFLRIGQQFIPDTRTQLGWRILFDPTRLPYAEIPAAAAQVTAFGARLRELLEARQLTLVSATELPAILEAYHDEVTHLAAPFGLLLLQIGALVLFFLVVIGALVRRGERREVALLQSRGAFDHQILLLRGVEALLICAFATLIAPILARQLLLAFAPLFSDVDNLPLKLDLTPFLYAGGAAALALVVLIATLRPVLRMPLILAGGSAMRSEKASWWQRYYLDVVLLVVGSAALLRLLNTDSPFAQTVIGDVQADPLLLIAPALLFIALGSISLRLFPAVAELAARYFSAQRGLTGVLATWQVSREPAHYGRITFLLALAVGIGWFATSFQATIRRSQLDQSAYEIGTDVRVNERDLLRSVNRAQPEATYLSLPEVAAAADVYRVGNVNFSLTDRAITYGQILGVDPESFRQAAYWRPDLGELPLPPAVDVPETGAALPVEPQRIGLWIKLDHIGAGLEDGIPVDAYTPDLGAATHYTDYFARLIDAQGGYIQVPLLPRYGEGVEEVTDMGLFVPRATNGTTALEFEAEVARVAELTASATGWVYLEGQVPLPGAVRLDSLYVRTFEQSARIFNANVVNGRPTWRLTLADLTLIDGAGDTVPLNLLADAGWQIATDWDQGAHATTSTSFERDTGREIEWFQTTDRTSFGLILNAPPIETIPAVFSRQYAEENSLLVGALVDLYVERQAVRFEVVGFADYFPSLYADEAPFAVVNRDALLYTLNRRPGAASYPQEAWLRLQPGGLSAAFAAALPGVIPADQRLVQNALTLDGALDQLQTDSLALGLIGLLFIAFAVALLLSLVSLLTYIALTAQGRRGEFAVLRALGLPSARLVASIALEQALVFVTAIGLGAVLGLLLSNQVLPTMATTTTGAAITPPFLVQVEVSALSQYGLILLLVLALVLFASVLLIRRLSLAQTLRYGDE